MTRRDFIQGLLTGMGVLVLPEMLLTARPMCSFAGRFPKPGTKDRCPVCGMFAHKYPKWAAGFVFKNGSKYFHCCPKCMLHNLNNITKYQPGQKRENLELVWVTEYYTTRRMDAQDVLFVVGTSLVGPMGLDLIPVKGRKAAENLKRDYHGEMIVTLTEITPDLIEQARKGRFKH
jgi:copper chaperone NosL